MQSVTFTRVLFSVSTMISVVNIIHT
jgi:hypothetical protein